MGQCEIGARFWGRPFFEAADGQLFDNLTLNHLAFGLVQILLRWSFYNNCFLEKGGLPKLLQAYCIAPLTFCGLKIWK